MIIRILGAAAGGGFPQWNCNGRNSASVRAGKPGFTARTQSSLAVSADGKRWVLLNASPDLRQQIAAAPALWPDASGPLRNSPIKSVVVTNADVDHIIGLINLREAQPFSIYASSRVMETIKANSVFNVLNEAVVPRRELPLDTHDRDRRRRRGFRLVDQSLRRPRQDRPLPRGRLRQEGLRQPRRRHHRPRGHGKSHR